MTPFCCAIAKKGTININSMNENDFKLPMSFDLLFVNFIIVTLIFYILISFPIQVENVLTSLL